MKWVVQSSYETVKDLFDAYDRRALGFIFSPMRSAACEFIIITTVEYFSRGGDLRGHHLLCAFCKHCKHTSMTKTYVYVC